MNERTMTCDRHDGMDEDLGDRRGRPAAATFLIDDGEVALRGRCLGSLADAAPSRADDGPARPRVL